MHPSGTFCGVFRRQALDRGAFLMQADKIVTGKLNLFSKSLRLLMLYVSHFFLIFLFHAGHNADDIAESVLLNFLRGDIARLGRCVSIITGEDGPLPRCKPFKYTYEKEIVMCVDNVDRTMSVSHFCYINLYYHCFFFFLSAAQVCVLQKARLLQHRVHLRAQRLSRTRARVPEEYRSLQAANYHQCELLATKNCRCIPCLIRSSKIWFCNLISIFLGQILFDQQSTFKSIRHIKHKSSVSK
jgi:hypothetical protein